MATYTIAPKEVQKITQELLNKHHPDLDEAGVTVAVLMAHAPRDENGLPTGPALKHANWPAAALVKVNSLKDRVEGKCDATILLDGDTWEDRPADVQRAIIDHELEHLEIRRKDGVIVEDDAGRPKLSIKPHDWQLSGFDSIVRRHKQAALEYQSQVDLARRFQQREFNWG